MKSLEKIWIVGGSSGIGLELVKIFLSNNKKVVTSSRNASENIQLLALQKVYPNTLYLLNLDANKESFKDEITIAWNTFNGLDCWFYNAGAYEVMSTEQWEKDKFLEMNNINYLGAVKLMIELLPFFEKQKSGTWIWNLSLSTYFGLPKGGGYSAPKAALLNLAQSIHPELKNKNIDLRIINHGFVKTRLTSKNSFDMPQLMSPEYAANTIYKNIQVDDSFEIRFPFKLSMFLKILSLLPYRLSLALTRRML